MSSLSHDIYSDPAFVEKYAVSIIDNPWNAYYERPASLALLPSVAETDILDAGCGPGIVSGILADRGAVVTSLDYSEQMVEQTKIRTAGRCRTVLFDLNNRLDLFPDAVFDIIYSSLVIHYIDNLRALFSEFSRILRPGGIFVFSTDHPGHPDFRKDPVTEKRIAEVFWSGYNVSMQVYERPWEDIVHDLEVHFTIDTVVTPEPTQECRIYYPEQYDYLKANPHFVCVRCRKKLVPEQKTKELTLPPAPLWFE